MQRAVAIVLLVVFLAPGAFAAETLPGTEPRVRRSRFDISRFFKHLVNRISALDEILTDVKP